MWPWNNISLHFKVTCTSLNLFSLLLKDRKPRPPPNSPPTLPNAILTISSLIFFMN